MARFNDVVAVFAAAARGPPCPLLEIAGQVRWNAAQRRFVCVTCRNSTFCDAASIAAHGAGKRHRKARKALADVGAAAHRAHCRDGGDGLVDSPSMAQLVAAHTRVRARVVCPALCPLSPHLVLVVVPHFV